MRSQGRGKYAVRFLGMCIILLLLVGNTAAGGEDAPPSGEAVCHASVGTPPQASAVGGSRNETLGVSLNAETRTVSVSVSEDVLTKLFESTGDTVSVTIPFVEEMRRYKAAFPCKSLSSGDGKKIELITPLGEIYLPTGMLKGQSGGETAAVGVGRGDSSAFPEDVLGLLGEGAVLDLSLTIDGGQAEWENPDFPVRVLIPYAPTAAQLRDPEHIVVLYVGGQGDAAVVPTGRYDAGTGELSFTATRFGGYAAASVKKQFSDLDGCTWAKRAIEVLASKGIACGTSENIFSPDGYVTRAEFLDMLLKALGLSASFDSNFSDVHAADAFSEAAGAAKKLGIAEGTGGGRFYPAKSISRQEMMALAVRALKRYKGFYVSGYTDVLAALNDGDEIAPWAAESIAALMDAGLIEGVSGRIDPLAKATRAETAVFLYRLYNRF